MAISEASARKFMVGFFGSLAAGLVTFLVTRPDAISLEEMMNPDAVAELASRFPEDEFVAAAVDWVAKEIEYEPITSDIHFYDHAIRGRSISTPTQTLIKGKGNCLAQAALLTAILRNRLPSDMVYTALGEVMNNGGGGHAWTIVEQSGVWKIADPTCEECSMISGKDPSYISYAYFNDEDVSCLPGTEICVNSRRVLVRRRNGH